MCMCSVRVCLFARAHLFLPKPSSFAFISSINGNHEPVTSISIAHELVHYAAALELWHGRGGGRCCAAA
jgi:hypothetical protein